MPTETFFRLPEQKRQRLSDALRRELARVPFSKLSISRVIQDAGIPRGSFYQYFTDREDLYRYVIADYTAFMETSARQALVDSHGDVFAATLAGYDAAVLFVRRQENLHLLANLFSEVDFKRFFSGGCSHEPPMLLTAELLPLIDLSRLRINSPEDIPEMLEILISMTRFSVFELFSAVNHEGEIREKLRRKIEILKRGMQKCSGERE